MSLRVMRPGNSVAATNKFARASDKKGQHSTTNEVLLQSRISCFWRRWNFFKALHRPYSVNFFSLIITNARFGMQCATHHSLSNSGFSLSERARQKTPTEKCRPKSWGNTLPCLTSLKFGRHNANLWWLRTHLEALKRQAGSGLGWRRSLTDCQS